MKTVKHSEGFTLIELMVGIIASSILALTVGLMLYYGWVSWRSSSESVAMQREATLAVKVIERRIRNASLDEIGGWGSGPVTFSLDPDFSASDIAPGSEVVLIANSFDISTNSLSGGVEVSFILQTSDQRNLGSYSTTVYPRN